MTSSLKQSFACLRHHCVKHDLSGAVWEQLIAADLCLNLKTLQWLLISVSVTTSAAIVFVQNHHREPDKYFFKEHRASWCHHLSCSMALHWSPQHRTESNMPPYVSPNTTLRTFRHLLPIFYNCRWSMQGQLGQFDFYGLTCCHRRGIHVISTTAIVQCVLFTGNRTSSPTHTPLAWKFDCLSKQTVSDNWKNNLVRFFFLFTEFSYLCDSYTKTPFSNIIYGGCNFTVVFTKPVVLNWVIQKYVSQINEN